MQWRFHRNPKRMRGRNPEFQKPLCEQGKTWGCCLVKGGQTVLGVSWPLQKSHRLFLQAQSRFLCQQLLTIWVTHEIVLVLFRPFLLYSKRPHGTSICSGEAQQADPLTSRAFSWLLSKFDVWLIPFWPHKIGPMTPLVLPIEGAVPGKKPPPLVTCVTGFAWGPVACSKPALLCVWFRLIVASQFLLSGWWCILDTFASQSGLGDVQWLEITVYMVLWAPSTCH